MVIVKDQKRIVEDVHILLLSNPWISMRALGEHIGMAPRAIEDAVRSEVRISLAEYQKRHIMKFQGGQHACVVGEKSIPIINPTEYYPQLKRFREYVNLHYSEAISLKVGARCACMAPKYFSHYFRKVMGFTISAWLRCFRVEKAMCLLEGHCDSIVQVAFSVGFKDVGTFQRAFKLFTGMTACHYRTLVRPEALCRWAYGDGLEMLT
jgi:AraC-like DNA-binding protein